MTSLPGSGQLPQLSDPTVSVKTEKQEKKTHYTQPNNKKMALFPQRSILKLLKVLYSSFGTFLGVYSISFVFPLSPSLILLFLFCPSFFTLHILLSSSCSSF